MDNQQTGSITRFEAIASLRAIRNARRRGKAIAHAKEETYRSNTENRHAYRGAKLHGGVRTMGFGKGMVSPIT